MKKVTIEIPEGYDKVLQFSLVGGDGSSANMFAGMFELRDGTVLVIDEYDSEQGPRYIQLNHSTDGFIN